MIIIASCNDQSSGEKNNKEKIDQFTKQLEDDIKNEVNYYYFNELENSKKVILDFKSSIETDPISKIVLYHNGSIVTDRVRLLDTNIHKSGVFVFELKHYIPHFNEIKLITSNGTELYLNTGLYNFEKVSIKNNLPEENRWELDSYFTSENIAQFEFDANFVREVVSNVEYDIILPELATSELLIENKVEFNEDENNLNLIISNDSEKIFPHSSSYEMLVIQSDITNNEQYIMASIMVVINP